MPIKEPYATKAKQIGRRLIELESCNPGLVRMRANRDLFVVSAMADKLKAIGIKKPFLQSSKQFLYDSFISYQAAVEACLPYTVLAGPPTEEGHTHCWAGFGLYAGWYGALAIDDLFKRKMGNMDGAALMVDIKPFYAQISEFLDPIPLSKDGSAFERALELDGAIQGLAAIVEHEYLNEHFPGYKVQSQALRKHAGRAFDVIEFTTPDGTLRILYFALTGYESFAPPTAKRFAAFGCLVARTEELLDSAVRCADQNDDDGIRKLFRSGRVMEVCQDTAIQIKEQKSAGKVLVSIDGFDGDYWTRSSYVQGQ